MIVSPSFSLVTVISFAYHHQTTVFWFGLSTVLQRSNMPDGGYLVGHYWLPNSAFSRTMREIANTAAQEFNNPNNRGLTIERKAAYSRFQSFAEK
jgi:hypothetical protein